MNLKQLLESKQEEIINDACISLSRAHLKNYDKCNEGENKSRLTNLFELTQKCAVSKNLLPIINYSEAIAKNRYESGFDFQEVHAAFNVLEEIIWKKIIAEVQPAELGEALGLISTILGAGKENLAGTYISLAAKTKIPSINLTELFSRN